MANQTLLTFRQAAQIAGTTWHTIRRWTADRGLPIQTIAGIRLIDSADLDRFLVESAKWRKEGLTITRRTGRAA